MATEIRTSGKAKPTVENDIVRWYWLLKLSGAAALFAGILFLTAVIGLITTALQPGALTVWLSLFQNNWLVVIFKLHTGIQGIQPNLLSQLSLLDIAILALVGVMGLGLHAALRSTHKIWSIIAMVLPFMGTILFIITNIAGRCAVMGAVLIISVIMLRSNIFNKVTASMGILASVLLLVGDFSVGIPHSNVIAILFGIGYLLLTAWFFLVAYKLYQPGLGD